VCHDFWQDRLQSLCENSNVARFVAPAFTSFGKSHLFCHSERSEESLFDVNSKKEREISRFARNDKKVGTFSASSSGGHFGIKQMPVPHAGRALQNALDYFEV
jgi:hypothetical protein